MSANVPGSDDAALQNLTDLWEAERTGTWPRGDLGGMVTDMVVVVVHNDVHVDAMH